MKVRVEVVCLNADGDERRRQVLTIERRELAMETLGMNLTESKALLAGVQDFVVAQQAREELEQRRACPHCRRRYTTKGSGSTPVSTVFDSSKNSRCHGRCAGPIFCCRPGRGFSTRIWTTYSAVGIQNSGRNHKRRSQSAMRLDPRLFGALLIGSYRS